MILLHSATMKAPRGLHGASRCPKEGQSQGSSWKDLGWQGVETRVYMYVHVPGLLPKQGYQKSQPLRQRASITCTVPAKGRPSRCVPSKTNAYGAPLHAPELDLGLGLPWGCPESTEAKSNRASPNPEGPFAPQPAHHPSSLAWLEFITIFLFGSQGSNLRSVRKGDAKHLYL